MEENVKNVQEGQDTAPVVKSKAEQYDDELRVFTESLESINDIKVLEEMEKPIIEEIKANEEVQASKCYDLPNYVEFKGTRFNRSKCYEYIVDILNTMEMNWQMALTMFEFIQYWKDAAKADLPGVPYEYYDATLRLLGQQKYSGYENLKRILVVNSLFADPREEYKDDLALTYFLAEKHNAILTRMDAIKALTEPVSTQE